MITEFMRISHILWIKVMKSIKSRVFGDNLKVWKIYPKQYIGVIHIYPQIINKMWILYFKCYLVENDVDNQII